MQRDNAVCGVGVAYNAKLGGIIYISVFILYTAARHDPSTMDLPLCVYIELYIHNIYLYKYNMYIIYLFCTGAAPDF